MSLHLMTPAPFASTGAVPVGMAVSSARQLIAANELTWLRWRTATSGAPLDAWLTRRGLDPSDIREAGWTFGWAGDNWHDLADLLRRHRIPLRVGLEAGVVRRAESGRVYDGFRDRIVIPVRDLISGQILGFTARRLEDTDDNVPKYINSPNNVAYQKGRCLLGGWEARQHLRTHSGRIDALVICEGPFDVIRVSAAQRWVAVAPCGTALTQTQAEWITALARAHGLPVQLAFDGDPAGRDATWRAWDLLRDAGARGLCPAEVPEGRDPAELTDTELASALTLPTRPPPLPVSLGLGRSDDLFAAPPQR